MKAKLSATFLVCLLFCISNQGAATMCVLSNIVVTQAATGRWARGQPEYAVTVKNMCGCPQLHVKLSCHGFNSTVMVDESKLRPEDDGGLCLLNNGEPVVQDRVVTFSYAWSSQFELAPVHSTFGCK